MNMAVPLIIFVGLIILFIFSASIYKGFSEPVVSIYTMLEDSCKSDCEKLNQTYWKTKVRGPISSFFQDNECWCLDKDNRPMEV